MFVSRRQSRRRKLYQSMRAMATLAPSSIQKLFAAIAWRRSQPAPATIRMRTTVRTVRRENKKKTTIETRRHSGTGQKKRHLPQRHRGTENRIEGRRIDHPRRSRRKTKKPGPCGPGQLRQLFTSLASRYFTEIAKLEVAVLSDDENLMFFGGVHQNPVEFCCVFVGLRTPEVLARI